MALTATEQAAVEQTFEDARIAIPPNGGIAAIGQQPTAWSGSANAFICNLVARANQSLPDAGVWVPAFAMFQPEDLGPVGSPYAGLEGIVVQLNGGLVGVTGVYVLSLFVHLESIEHSGEGDGTITLAFFKRPLDYDPDNGLDGFEQFGPDADLAVPTATVGDGFLHIVFGGYMEAGEILDVYIKSTEPTTFSLHPSAISVYQVR